MNKEELVALVAKKNPKVFRSKAAALRALDAVLDGIAAGVKRDLKRGVTLVNFGTFKIRSMRKRKGADPRTGQPIVIPSGKTVKFKCGKGLREKVDKDWAKKQEPQTVDMPKS